MIKGKILVTGGTGFIGYYLLERLRSFSEVRCFVRKNSDSSKLSDFEIFYGDLRNKEDVETAVSGVEYVIHLGATTQSKSYKINYEVNVVGTKNVVDACRKYKVKKLIHLSTIVVLFNNKREYGKTKKMADDIVRKSNVDYVILRLAFVYGKNDRYISRFIKFIRRSPIFPVIGNGKGKMQPIYVEDVCKAIISALKSKVKNKVYTITGPERLNFNEVLDLIMKELNIRRRKVYIPLSFILPFIWLYEKVARNPKIRVEQLFYLNNDSFFDGNKTNKDLNFKPIGLKDGIRRIISS